MLSLQEVGAQQADVLGGDRLNRRGTSSAWSQGSSYDRRRRRERLIARFGIGRQEDGAKTRVKCAHCGRVMRADGRVDADGNRRFTWEVDRFPICGHAGGRYVDDNVVVSCRPCNQSRCSRTHHRHAPPPRDLVVAGAA